ncbi:hypothetical protein HYU92_03615 [Candidatus Curtissbacteria bacterium]|nr:hypothetical protein [Candidatus Curtissbacteria bacterium]
MEKQKKSEVKLSSAQLNHFTSKYKSGDFREFVSTLDDEKLTFLTLGYQDTVKDKPRSKTLKNIQEILIGEKIKRMRRPETPTSFYKIDDVVAAVESYLPNTGTALKLALAVATSGTRINRVMLWMLLVGSPSSGKTDLVKLFKNSKSVYSLDNLTLNAFISGERQTEKQKVYDLLPQLANKCLVIKDWTVIFSLDEKMSKKIVGDMVGIYDKSLSKFSSRRGQITYDAEFSHLGCITPATLNKHQTYLNMIGPRFLHYTIPSLSKDDEEASFKAIFGNTDRQTLEKEVRSIVSAYLDQLNEKDISEIKPVSDEVREYLTLASRFTAKARGIVIIQASSFKNEDGDNITYYEPLDIQIEQPWRAVQQLLTLSTYLTLVSNKLEVGIEAMEVIKEVVVSSMPADRAQAVRALKDAPDGEITAKYLSEQVDKSQKTTRRLLDELSFLGIVEKIKGTGQIATSYRLIPEFKDFITLDPAEFMSTNYGGTKTPDGIPHEQDNLPESPKTLEEVLGELRF